MRDFFDDFLEEKFSVGGGIEKVLYSELTPKFSTGKMYFDDLKFSFR